MEHYDVVIVGAGSAGCALAGRLSENPSRRVLLLEAGPDCRQLTDFPPEILDHYSRRGAQPDHPNNWTFTGSLTDELTFRLPRGRILGGSSAINGAYFVRGAREDFGRWEALGNPAWSYANVLPVYRRLEDDADFSGEYHGRGGPVPVRRDHAARSHPITDAFFEAAFALGFPEHGDKNAPGDPGIGMIPRNVVDGRRINAAISHVLPHRDRPNLEVRGGVFVRRLCFSGTRATGVEIDAADGTAEIGADEIVLSAGAVKSPHLLLCSGIGPAAELRALGLPVVCDAPGVGREFMDHAHVAVRYRPEEEIPNTPGSAVTHATLSLTVDGSPYLGDVEIINRAGPKRVGGESRDSAGGERSVAGELSLGIGLQQPESRGEIRLTSPDPHVQPAIAYHYLSRDLDRSRLRAAVRICAELLATGDFAKLVAARTEPDDATLASEEELDAWIRSDLATATHLSRSCHMGPESDPTAVVDEQCRVRGIEGLRVVDTSVMPFITSHGPSATAVMIGERASDFF